MKVKPKRNQSRRVVTLQTCPLRRMTSVLMMGCVSAVMTISILMWKAMPVTRAAREAFKTQLSSTLDSWMMRRATVITTVCSKRRTLRRLLIRRPASMQRVKQVTERRTQWQGKTRTHQQKAWIWALRIQMNQNLAWTFLIKTNKKLPVIKALPLCEASVWECHYPADFQEVCWFASSLQLKATQIFCRNTVTKPGSTSIWKTSYLVNAELLHAGAHTYTPPTVTNSSHCLKETFVKYF